MYIAHSSCEESAFKMVIFHLIHSTTPEVFSTAHGLCYNCHLNEPSLQNRDGLVISAAMPRRISPAWVFIIARREILHQSAWVGTTAERPPAKCRHTRAAESGRHACEIILRLPTMKDTSRIPTSLDAFEMHFKPHLSKSEREIL